MLKAATFLSIKFKSRVHYFWELLNRITEP
jgi:hypothetical protein